MVDQPKFPPGWRVEGPSGEIVQQADGPVAAEMTGVTESERGDDDGSDRAASGE